MATLSKTQKAQRYEELERLVEKYRDFHEDELGGRPAFDGGEPEPFNKRSVDYGIRSGELEAELAQIESLKDLEEFRKEEERVTAIELIESRESELKG